jgi:PAS domain S-box-containing protein
VDAAGTGRRTADAVVVATARSGEVVFSNREASRVVGRRLAEIAQEPEFEILHPDGRPYEASEWQLARTIATGEEIVDEEFLYVLPDGSRVAYRCSSSPIHDAEGRIVAAVSVTSDVSEEDRADELIASHVSLLETITDAIVGTDPEFRLTVWNSGAERLYGFTAEEVMGRDARAVGSYPGDTARTDLEAELLETERSRTELTAVRKDGTSVEVEMIAAAVRDDAGEISRGGPASGVPANRDHPREHRRRVLPRGRRVALHLLQPAGARPRPGRARPRRPGRRPARDELLDGVSRAPRYAVRRRAPPGGPRAGGRRLRGPFPDQ